MTSSAAIDSDHGDGRTVVAEGLPFRVGYSELGTLFGMVYDHVRGEHAKHDKPGLLVLAVDLGTASVVGTSWIKTRPDAINALSVGRHRECDLCLPRDPTISLRHLAIMTHPFAPGGDRVSFRVLDLRTSLAFQDCFGHRLEGVIADGAAMLALGRYALVLLPTGGGTALPEASSTAWNMVADPVYLDQGTQITLLSSISELRGSTNSGPTDARTGAARPPAVPRESFPDAELGHRTSFSVIEGPLRASKGLLASGEEPLGTLEVKADGLSQTLAVGARAAKRGLLIGCYDRCDDAVLSHVQHTSISRVHLLLWLHDATLYAIDTASTNGTFVQQGPKRVRARMVRLASGLELVLADDRARLLWTPID